MLDHVVAAIFLLVCVIGPTFAEMRIADPMGNEISDEWIKNWVREELAARDGNIEALQAQVAVRDVYRDYRCIYIPICIDIETIDALVRRLEIEYGEQRDAPHLRLAHRQMQDDLAWIAATDAYYATNLYYGCPQMLVAGIKSCKEVHAVYAAFGDTGTIFSGARMESANIFKKSFAVNSKRTVTWARSHCRFVLLRIRVLSESRTYSVPLFLKRQCDRTLLNPNPTADPAAGLLSILRGAQYVRPDVRLPVRRRCD
jgi:hypothetical protein